MKKSIRKILTSAVPVIAVIAASAGGRLTSNHNETVVRGGSR
jgi:hypothetical protein